MAENETINNNSRIFYVDPNDVFEFGDSNGNAPLTPSYEDMSIAFNLIIEKYDRFDNQARNRLGLCWCDKLSGDGHYNVLNGSISDENGVYDSQGNRYLSTYYIDISADGYNKGEQIEGLGVSSIEVAFDSYYTPTVVIKFVDVRGSALFGREEAIHTSASGNGEINASNIFGSFFTIPYPKFRLQIKGFFGKAVTYQLTVSNFKANFNAQTGNVEATVQFVGYTWSLLTDIPLQYLVAAPYCDYAGATYWNEHKMQDSWRLTGGEEPPTLFDFFNKIRDCVAEYKQTDGNAEDDTETELYNNINEAQKLIEYINQIKQYLKDSDTIAKNKGEIDDLFGEISRQVESLAGVIDTSKKPNEAYVVNEEKSKTVGYAFQPTESIPVTLFDYDNIIKQLSANEKLNFQPPSHIMSSPLDELFRLAWFYPSKVYTEESTKRTFKLFNKEEPKTQFGMVRHTTYKQYIDTKNEVYTEEKTITTYTPSSFEDLRSEADSLIKGNNESLEERKREREIEFIKESIASIGFTPNIYNIFKILMCHLETFCHILFEAGNEIKNQGDGRLASALGVKNTNTDLPERCVFNEKQRLPAWTAIFNNNSSSTQTVDELKYTDMYQWVGAIAANKWVEEEVVWSLNNAIQYVGKNSSNTNSASAVSKINYIPLLPCDIFNINGPFHDSVYGGFQTFVGHLSLRIAQILGIMDTGLAIDNTMLETVAKADAYNFFYSCQSINDIKKLITENIGEGPAADIISGMVTCDSQYDNKATVREEDGKSYYVYEIKPNARGCIKGRHNIFKLNNNNYDYTYFLNKDDKYYVPTRLMLFSKANYDKCIKTEVYNGETIFNGVLINGTLEKSNKWLTNALDKKEYLNYDEFKIIDNEDDIKQIEDMYTSIKDGSFKVNGYPPPANELSALVDRYWKLSFEDYKKSIESIPRYIIGKSYKPYFDKYKDYKDKCLPQKNQICSNEEVITIACDNVKHKYYELGDEYGKIEDEDIKDFYIKMLAVYNTNNNSIASIFGHPFYYTQNQIENENDRLCAKACLFLETLPHLGEHYEHNLHTEHGAFGIYNKLSILYIGSLLWRQRNVDKDPSHLDDGIKYTNSTVGPQYRPYISNGRALTMGDVTGLFIAKDTEDLPDKCVDINRYIAKETDNNLYKNLNDNVKTQLIEYFKKFATTVFKYYITNKCEQYDDTNNPYANGTLYQKYLDTLRDKVRAHPDETIEETKRMGNCYAFGLIKTSETESNTGLYLVFDEVVTKENGIQDKIKDILFGKVVLMNSGAVGKPKKNISIPSSAFKGYISGFVKKLDEIVKALTTGADYSRTDIVENQQTDENLLLGIYLYCKNIWEKWLMPLSGDAILPDDDGSRQYSKHFDVSEFFEKNFKFIDSYYNNIGKLLKINLDKLLSNYESRIDKASLFAFISDIVADHRCIFVGLPDFVNLGLGINGNASAEAVKNLKNLFKPVPFNQMEAPRLNNNFVVVYTYPPAKHLPDSVMYKYDGFDIYSTQNGDVPPIFSLNGVKGEITEENAVRIYNQCGIAETGYNIPAFGVCFGKQNNHLFKNFNISMDNPVETEQSIKTLWHVAELAKGHDRKVCFYGQDVYNIFSNYSYQIEVEMMGNAQIQPLMYFQLLNIPMWRGAYMIFNVSHTMTPGNMVTKFKGMKMSKNPVPILSKYWSFVIGDDENGNPIYSDGDIYDAVDFMSSGSVGNVKPKEGRDLDASSNNMDAWKERGESTNAPAKYLNCGDNNYYMPKLSNYIFKTKKGNLNLMKTINFIYNYAHWADQTPEKPKAGCKGVTKGYKKLPTCSIGHCAHYVFNAIEAGLGQSLGGLGGNANDIGSLEFFTKHLGYEVVYNGPATKTPSVEKALPGDVVRQAVGSGHVAMFTGRHWVSDFIQKNGLNSAHDGMVTQVFRIPGIENALVRTSNSDGSYNKPSGNQSIFEANTEYSYNAICQPEGKFNYTQENIKKCVLYFVAHGEGGNRNLSGNNSTDYCGINNNRYTTLFYTAERKRVLNATPQNGFVAAYDNAVFDFYYSTYFMPYKEFFENCRNPYCRYAALLCIKGGSQYAAEALSSVMSGASLTKPSAALKEKLGETTFTKQLADAFWDKLFERYPDYNHGRVNTTKDFTQFNKIY